MQKILKETVETHKLEFHTYNCYCTAALEFFNEAPLYKSKAPEELEGKIKR